MEYQELKKKYMKRIKQKEIDLLNDMAFNGFRIRFYNSYGYQENIIK